MNKDRWITSLGAIGTTLALIMFVALLEIAHSNLVEGTEIFIQPAAAATNCTVWCLYAFLKKDKYVFIANFPGIILGVITTITAFI